MSLPYQIYLFPAAVVPHCMSYAVFRFMLSAAR